MHLAMGVSIAIKAGDDGKFLTATTEEVEELDSSWGGFARENMISSSE